MPTATSAPATELGDDRLLDGLGELSLYTPGQLRLLDGAPGDLTRTELLSASGDSMLLDVSEVQVRVDPRELLTSIVGSGERQVLAWRLQGRTGPWPERAAGSSDRFGDFTAGGDGSGPPALPAAEDVPADPGPPAAPCLAFVLADTDVVADGMWVAADRRDGQVVGYRAYADNGRLVEALLAELAGGADLAAIGPRPAYTRPFTRLVELERTAEERLARELSEARALEEQLAAELLADEERLAATGVRPDEARTRDLRRRLADAREGLRALLVDRDAAAEDLKARLVRANLAGFPVLVLAAWLLAAVLRRRG